MLESPRFLLGIDERKDIMTFRFSFNANGLAIRNKQQFIDLNVALRPSSFLVMDDLDLTVDLYNKLNKGSIAIFRNYNESAANTQQSAAQQIQIWKDQGRLDVWRYALNEPNTSNDTINWLIDLMNRGADAGVKLVVGNWSVGAYERNDVLSGRWDNFIKTAAKYRGFHYVGFHEYMFGLLPWAWYDFNLIDDPTKVIQWNWPKPDSIKENGDNWLLLRSLWFNHRARQMGLQPFEKIITEFGWDRLPNLETQYKDQTLQLDTYAFDGGWHSSKAAGVNTYKRLFQIDFSNWSFDKAVVEQLKWADSMYPDDYVGFNLFTWSLSQDWIAGGYDFSGLSDVHKAMAEWANGVNGLPQEPKKIINPIDDNDVRWTIGTITPTVSALNLRYAPSTDGNTPFSALSGSVKGSIVLDTGISGWSQIRLQDGTKAWVSSQYIDFQPEVAMITINLTADDAKAAINFAEGVLRTVKV